MAFILVSSNPTASLTNVQSRITVAENTLSAMKTRAGIQLGESMHIAKESNASFKASS